MTTPVVDLDLAPLAGARTYLAAAIETATGYTCHASYTVAFGTPCYVLTGNGWTTLNGDLVSYSITVTCLYANASGASNLADAVEELARAAALACIDANGRIEDVPAPGTVTLGDRQYAAVAFTVALPVTLR